jgi:UDP-N-acetylglucosamine 2-epimerase
MRILSIVGARPQFIKLAPLHNALLNNNSLQITHKIIHTGQHFDEEMSKLFFEQLEIPEPEYNLKISGGNHGEQTGKMLTGIENILLKEKPDLVIVFGDTNSTLAGSIASVKLGIKTIHIEAGLRSYNRMMPEEINRIVSDHTSDFLFAPTQTAVDNLTGEGLFTKTFLSGDIMVDSLTNNIEKAKKYSSINSELNLESNNYYLLTLHRPYTVDDPKNLKLILDKLARLEKQIVFPVHPRTKKIIEDNKIISPSRIKIIKPVGYLDFIILEQNAEKIITDSGGIQKEAYILKKPCITLRPETEWIETVTEAWNLLLLPADEDFCERILNFSPSGKQRDVFGSNVADRMVNKIVTSIL